MNRKAQASEVLIYAISAIVVILILYFGYRGVSSFMKARESAELEKFKIQLKSDIQNAALDYGSLKILTYEIPQQYNSICLIDLKSVITNEIKNPIIKDSIETQSKNNAFLIGKETIGFEAGPLSIECKPYFLCINKTVGKIKLKLEGKGTSAMLLCE